jgi:hypothetical protein
MAFRKSTKTSKFRRPTFFIGFTRFKRNVINPDIKGVEQPSGVQCYGYSGQLCVFSQKNKIVEKIGSVTSVAKANLVVYVNFPVLFRYIAHGAEFRVQNKKNDGFLFLLISSVFSFFLKKKKHEKSKVVLPLL